MENYTIDYKFLVARARASLDLQHNANENSLTNDEAETYFGKRIVAWHTAFIKDEQLYNSSIDLLNDDGEMEALYREGVKSCYETAAESDSYKLALLSLGALIRNDHATGVEWDATLFMTVL